MSRIVKIQGEHPIFPGNACVHCLQPSTRHVQIMMLKEGYHVRQVAMPFCDDCIARREHRSRRQVQFERLSLVANVVLALTVGLWTYTQISHGDSIAGGWEWGVLLGVLVALILFGLTYMVARAWSWGFRSAETKAALNAVRIRDFDWETTTLEFANETYAERFAQVNRKE